MNDLERFSYIVRQKSKENKQTIALLAKDELIGNILAVLRIELESLVRVIFLLNQSLDERAHLISLSLNDKDWRLRNKSKVTITSMVDLADKMNGWSKSVYKFGCAFIHLSSFSAYETNDPFQKLDSTESNAIKTHLNIYHGYPLSMNLSIKSISPYLPMVFDKIESNLESYIRNLEKNEFIK